MLFTWKPFSVLQLTLFVCCLFFACVLQAQIEDLPSSDLITTHDGANHLELEKKPTPVASQNKDHTSDCVDLPAYDDTYTDSRGYARGYWFTAQSDFVITALRVPTDIGTDPQTIQVVRLDSPPPFFPASTMDATTLFYATGVAGTDYIATDIFIAAGDMIGILGARMTASGNALVSYANTNTAVVNIEGDPTLITRFISQQRINNGPVNEFATSFVTAIGRVEMCTKAIFIEIGCTGDVTSAENGETTITTQGCVTPPPYTQDKLVMNSYDFCGDGEIMTQVTSTSGSGWAGLMMRESEEAGSKKFALSVNQSYLARREVRTATNGSAYPQQFPAFGKRWLRLVRNGSQFTGFVSTNGVNWQLVMAANIAMDDCLVVGLFATGANNAEFSATFSNTTVNNGLGLVDDVSMPQAHLAPQTTYGQSLRATVHPNPTTDWVQVQFDQELTPGTLLELFDGAGRAVLKRPAQQTTILDVQDLQPGVYYLRLLSDADAAVLQRVIVN